MTKNEAYYAGKAARQVNPDDDIGDHMPVNVHQDTELRTEYRNGWTDAGANWSAHHCREMGMPAMHPARR